MIAWMVSNPVTVSLLLLFYLVVLVKVIRAMVDWGSGDAEARLPDEVRRHDYR